MYALILSDQEYIPFEGVRAALEKEGFTVIGSEVESLDEDAPLPPNIVLWVLFEWNTFEAYPNFPVYGMVRIASLDHPPNKTLFRVYRSPWWARLYYSILMQALFVWAKWKRRLNINCSAEPQH